MGCNILLPYTTESWSHYAMGPVLYYAIGTVVNITKKLSQTLKSSSVSFSVENEKNIFLLSFRLFFGLVYIFQE